MHYEFKLPDLGEGLSEGEIVKWLLKEGNIVKEDQNVLEIETAKAIVEIPCPKAGIVKKLLFKEGDVVKVGEALFVIETQENEKDIFTDAVHAHYEPENEPKNIFFEKGSLATPKVRKSARDMHIDINKVTGTGTNGRITEEDLKKYAEVIKPVAEYGAVEKIKLHGIRREIAEAITKSVSLIPHATVIYDAIVTKLAEFRERAKKKAEGIGVKVTYLPLIVKAVISSLEKHPYFNSTLNTETNEIIVKKYYNIGIAVDTQYGVVVPIIKEADKKDIFQLAREMEELSAKARLRQLILDDVRGGTFTITNVGAVGCRLSIPVINYPESAILAIHRITDTPVVIDGKITIQKLMPMSLSFDHRIVDGAQAARFMNDIVRLLEEPDWLNAYL